MRIRVLWVHVAKWCISCPGLLAHWYSSILRLKHSPWSTNSTLHIQFLHTKQLLMGHIFVNPVDSEAYMAMLW